MFMLAPAPRVFTRYKGFPPSTKTNISKFQFQLKCRVTFEQDSRELFEIILHFIFYISHVTHSPIEWFFGFEHNYTLHSNQIFDWKRSNNIETKKH